MILVGQYDSPFARRVAITLRMLGFKYEHRPWSVWSDADRLAQLNPLRRVPTLVLDDGTALVETAAIIDYLEELAPPEKSLLARSGLVRRDALRLCGLISGLADKAVSLFYENLLRSSPLESLVERLEKQITETFDLLEADLKSRQSEFWFGTQLSQPDIALTCAWRFTQEAHPNRFATARWLALASLAARCESLPEFKEINQPLIVNVAKPSAAAPEALELFIVDKNDSSWSLRPWLVLVHHSIPFRETCFVASNPDTPRKLLEVSPTGRVPLLRVGDQAVWESLAIMETLADLFPQLPIWPEDPKLRRHARCVASEMHAGFFELRRHCTMNLALRTHVELDPARARELKRFEELVANARAQHALPGPYLFGAFSAADAMLAPVATRIRSYGLPVGSVTQTWMDAIFALPAFQRWEAEAAQERATREPAEVIGVPLRRSVETRIPDGPCYAVIFSNQRAPAGDSAFAYETEYQKTAARMEELARLSPGFLGLESSSDRAGFGITVSYWSSLDAIATWRAQTEHCAAQAQGRAQFYAAYDLRVARVEKHRHFHAS